MILKYNIGKRVTHGKSLDVIFAFATYLEKELISSGTQLKQS